MEPILLVASAWTGLMPGTRSMAGSWMSPPPPTTASTQPAARPATTIRMTVPSWIDSSPETTTCKGAASAVAHGVDHVVNSLVNGYILGIAAAAVLDLHDAVHESAPDGEDGGDADQFGIAELHAGGNLGAVVIDDVEAGSFELQGEFFGGGEDFLAAAHGHNVDVGRGDGARPDQAPVIVVGLCQGRHGAGDADAVGAHGHHHLLAVLVQDFQVQGGGVLPAELEDVAHFDAAGGFEGTGTVGCLVAGAHLGAFDDSVPAEVASGDEAKDVLAGLVGAGDPGRAADDAGIHKVEQLCGALAAQQRRIQGHAGAEVPLDDQGLLLEVVLIGGFERDLAGNRQEGPDVRLDALEVDAAVARHADDDDLAFAGRQCHGEDDVLEGVSGSPGAAVGLGPRDKGVGGVHEGFNRRRVRGVADFRGRRVAEVDVCGDHCGDGLDVGCVTAGGPYEGVFADFGGVQEFLALGPAHGTRGGCHRNDIEAEALENLQVRAAVRRVAGVQAGVVDVEGVGILHDELAAAQQACPGTRLIAVLVLDLIDAQGQVL